MKTCNACKGKLIERTERDPNGVLFSYYSCPTCNNSFLDLDQLHQVAEKYRTLKRYRVKLTTWGVSKGIRIPKELIKKYRFHDEVSLIEEEGGIRIIS